MKLLIIGATGRCGLATTKKALQCEDFDVTAFVRTSSTLPEHTRKKIKVIIGDILNADDICDAINGHDAVISCLGSRTFGATTLYSIGMQNIVAGMLKHDVKDLYFIGGIIYMPGFPKPPELPPVTEDVERMISFITNSNDIAWVGCMPPDILDGECTEHYKAAVNSLPGPGKVTAGDIADWMVSSLSDQAQREKNKHKLFGISSMDL